jgi:L-lactate dehydrogenase complex protein LldE
MAGTGSPDGEAPAGRLPVVLFGTCLGDLMAPGTVADARRVLEACRCDVSAPDGATCCGQPAFNSGFDREARRVARRTLRALDRTAGPIVVPSGSCGAMMRVHWRELRVKDAPRQLLAAVEGLELVELGSAERCCGFGGTFSVRYPDVSVAMADSKLTDVDGAGVDALVSGDGGCLMHLGGRMSRTGSQVRALHLASLLAEAL